MLRVLVLHDAMQLLLLPLLWAFLKMFNYIHVRSGTGRPGLQVVHDS